MNLVIAAQQAATRSALQMLFREEPDLNVVGEAANREALVAHVDSLRPDVVLLDWRLPGQPTAELISALHERNRRPTVVVLSGRPEFEQVARAAGADAFFNMGDPPRRLLALLHTLFEGRGEKQDSPQPG
jgi:two-component system response regulator DesR